MLYRHALLSATERGHYGVSMKLQHAASIFNEGVDYDVRSEAVYEPCNDGDDKEEAGMRTA